MLLAPLLTIENYSPEIFSLTIPFLEITLEPRYYGLFYAISILLGYRIHVAESKRRNLALNEDEIMNYVLLVFLGGLIGGRTYEVIFEWSNHYANQPWYEVFAIWHGGLAIHGGILGGTLAVYLYCRRKNLRFWEMADLGAICLILGQAIGRWGNFTNGEAAGPVTDAWTGVVFPQGASAYAGGQAVHPTMIYESIGNFAIFFVLWKLRLKNFRPGMLIALHFILYSILRSSLTPFRIDNQFFTFMGEKILAPYAISIVLVSAGIFLIVSRRLWETDTPPKAAISSETSSTTASSKANPSKETVPQTGPSQSIEPPLPAKVATSIPKPAPSTPAPPRASGKSRSSKKRRKR